NRERPSRLVGAIAAGAVVAWLTAHAERGLALALELFGGAVATIGAPAAHQLLHALLVELGSLALEKGPLVPVEAQPAQAVENCLHRRLGRALAIGVLDAQDERPALAAGEQVAEERGARA